MKFFFPSFPFIRFFRLAVWLLTWGLLLCSLGCEAQRAPHTEDASIITYQQLPSIAQQTYDLIKKGGPFPFDKDGTVFGNYEKILPEQNRGYYREYTVQYPNARNRGAKRIIAGGRKGSEDIFYYTADHYKTFKRIVEEKAICHNQC